MKNFFKNFYLSRHTLAILSSFILQFRICIQAIRRQLQSGESREQGIFAVDGDGFSSMAI